MALTTTTRVTKTQDHVGSAKDGIVKSFNALAATNYIKGQFVTINTAGRVVINATADTLIDGIVAANVDNTLGGNDDVKVPILLKGNVWADFFCRATGNYKQAQIGTTCGVAQGTGVATTGQAVVAAGTTGRRPFVSLSIQAVPSAGPLARKGLFFFRGSGKFV